MPPLQGLRQYLSIRTKPGISSKPPSNFISGQDSRPPLHPGFPRDAVFATGGRSQGSSFTTTGNARPRSTPPSTPPDQSSQASTPELEGQGIPEVKPALKMELSPGDQVPRVPRGAKVKEDDIRELGDLIRSRFALDNQIWKGRGKTRPTLRTLMERSDQIRIKILQILQNWNESEVWETTADWEKFKLIREKFENGGAKIWCEGPLPWDPIYD